MQKKPGPLLLVYFMVPAIASVPAVDGFPTVANNLFVIGFSFNSDVPAVGWRPLMFHLSLVVLPALLFLFS